MTTTLEQQSVRPVAHAAGRRAAVESERHSPRRPWRRVLSIVTMVLAVALLWPAQFGGFTGLTVVDGVSMQPTYHTGDLVVSVRLPSYSTGDILSYQVPAGQDGEGGRVIHRVFSVEESAAGPVYTTKGDNNPSIDPWQFGTSSVLGKAIFMIPSVGSLFGGNLTSIVIGLAAGLIVTTFLWGLGSRKKSRHR